MPTADVSNLRNIALLSHSGAGKTSLCEAMLFHVNATTRIGRVEDGNTVSDYEPEEVKRGGSIQTTLVACEWGDKKVNFLDTPGYDDFRGEVASALRVVEGAAILVAAQSGVDVGTERSWADAEAAGLPRIFVVNKMDRENASFSRCVADIQATFGRRCVPLYLVNGDAEGFEQVISVIDPPADLPDGFAQQLETARDQLVEAAAESDETLADKYLEGEELTQAEIVDGVRSAVWKGELVPILATSAGKSLGLTELLETIQAFLPSPADGVKPPVTNGVELEADPDGSLATFVFKTTADPFVGKLSVFRVYQGTIKSNSEVWNAGREQSERIGQLYLPRGKAQENVAQVMAGDMGAIGKLSATVTGDTLSTRDNPVTLQSMQFPVGYYGVAVVPGSKADLDKMSSALSRIVEEDPTLHLSRASDTNETLLTGLGEAQIEVAMDKIRRKFGADLKVRLPKVAYKETITQVTQTEYRHKKQSGGHGQYGHVLLRLEPLERTEGFQFKSEVVGGRVPKEYIPSVEKGVVKAMEEGVLAGFPLVDVKAVIYDGSYHDVDSSGMSFEIAGNQALRKGIPQASPILLEPIMRLTITAPDAYTGEVMSDLNGKRGRILGMNPHDNVTTIEAEVPLSETQRYAQDLRSLSQGRGEYSLSFDHYEAVPPNIEPRVIEDAKRAREEERA